METNKIYLGDCEEILKSFPDNSVDVVITSPPYNIGGKYKEYEDNLSSEEYYNFTRDVINQLLRVTNKQVFYNIQYLSGNKKALFRIIGDFAPWIKDMMIWKKPRAMATSYQTMVHNYEFIIVFDKDDKRSYDANLKGFMTCFEFDPNIEYHSDNNQAIMSKKMCTMLVQRFTKEGDVILDPFMGTGTTAVCALENNRSYLGIEIAKSCYDESLSRIDQVAKNKKLDLYFT